MKKTNKPSNPLKVFNDNRAMAYKKAGGAMKDFKSSLRKAQSGTTVDSEPVPPTPSTSTSTPAANTSTTPAAPNFSTMSNKQFKQYKKGVKREKKIENIKSGKQTERVDNIIKAVGSGADAISNVAGAVKATRESIAPRKRGGAIKSRPIAKRGGSIKSRKK